MAETLNATIRDVGVEQAAATISAQLGEPNIPLLEQVITHIGPQKALAFLQRTLEIESSGGAMVLDGTRRRTPGGVFFALVKEGLSRRVRDRLFPAPARSPAPRRGKEATTPQPSPRPTPLEAWAGREEVYRELVASKEIGKATSMKVTLIGRPGKVSQPGPYVMTTMRGPEKVPSVPKGLPTPPPNKLMYVVYIAEKQWGKVDEAIKNPDDVLIVEGFLTYDEGLKRMSVFAQNVTTKLLQQAQRAAQ